MNESNGPEPYVLTFEHHPDHLRAVVEGETDTFEISRAYWAAIAAECRRVNAKRVLVEENIVEQSSVADAFQLGSELPHLGFGSIKVAFVDRYADHGEINDFSALVAGNRVSGGCIFRNVPDGI